MHVENYIFIMTVNIKTKNVFIAKEKGHKNTVRQKKKKKKQNKTKKKRVNNYVKVDNVDKFAG